MGQATNGQTKGEGSPSLGIYDIRSAVDVSSPIPISTIDMNLNPELAVSA